MNETEALIRDADLLAQLEDARGKFGFNIQCSILATTQKRRDAEREATAQKAAALAAMPRETRRRAIVREVFENHAPSPKDVRHLHSLLAICGLPYTRQPMDVRRYVKRQGQMSVVFYAQDLEAPGGRLIPQPLPWGPKARLVLMHLCSEALRQKSPTIEIADTFTAFVRDLGFADNGGRGGALTAFKEQLNALAACTMRMNFSNDEQTKNRAIVPIEGFDIWLSDNPAQRSLWPSTVTFGATMFESLKRHALPVNVRAVKAFAGSARKLDLYFWLGYRLHNIDQPLHLSWNALTEQFGEGFSRPRDFQRQLAEELGHITEVFPKLPVKLTSNGLSLQPAGPDVLALPAPRPAKKRA